jgi:hypothetical protein
MGLSIVYGEVEAMKTGYEIRQLSIQKRDLTHRLKEREFQIASVTSPEKLEAQMLAYNVKLSSSHLMKIARLESQETDASASGQGNSALTRFLVPTAQADTPR